MSCERIHSQCWNADRFAGRCTHSLLPDISYTCIQANKPVRAAIMGRKACIYSQERINDRTSSCVAREGVIFKALRCQHVADALPWFLLRNGAATFLSVQRRSRGAVKRGDQTDRLTATQTKQPGVEQNKDSVLRVKKKKENISI